jgi:hypothetical protein
MNPEFRRNLWLELTPRRMVLMVGVLALAFFAAALPGGLSYGPSSIAKWLYYVIVVLWGTRSAALSVVGEIRDRTWDAQRLSALGPGDMTWGKLFGATAYNWLGGLICLVVLLAGIGAHEGVAVAAVEAVYYLVVGIIAQAASLLASLIAIRRRQGHSRLEIMLYQFVGLAAALAVYFVWSAADPTAALVPRVHAADTIPWWGHVLDARAFLLVSLALFAGWLLVACYREMRLELMVPNAPTVWTAFLLFLGVYVAGFDSWMKENSGAAALDPVAIRLVLACSTYVVVAYAMVLLEPKDRVHYRWLLGQLLSGRLGAWLSGLQAWMVSYAAAVLVAAAFLAWVGRSQPFGEEQATVAAVLGFMTRDMAIFVLVHTFAGRARGDFAAVIVLVALYALVPAILNGLHFENALVLFYPTPRNPIWVGPLLAWAEGIVVAALAMGRLFAGSGSRAAAAAA